MSPSAAVKSSFTIGRLTLKSNIFLSPLESVSDVGFRYLCAQNGAGLTFTEMIRGQGEQYTL
jgi:tRNA-dihydrouridine synthase B